MLPQYGTEDQQTANDIYIQDIIIEGGYGQVEESTNIEKALYPNGCRFYISAPSPFNESTPLVDNLVAYFQTLLNDVALPAHQKALNNVTDMSTLITRIVMSEFSLYTADRPLTINELKELIKLIYESSVNFIKMNAHTLTQDIHLAFGTMPVLASGSTRAIQWNCTLYVTLPLDSAKKPVLYFLEKMNPAYYDPHYITHDNQKLKLKNKEVRRIYNAATYLHPANLVAFKGTADETFITLHIPTGNVFTVETNHNEELTIVYEICVDHHVGEGQKAYKNYINRYMQDGKKPPSLISHVIVSNIVNTIPAHCVSHSLTKAEPNGSLVKDSGPPFFVEECSLFGDIKILYYPPKQILPYYSAQQELWNTLKTIDRNTDTCVLMTNLDELLNLDANINTANSSNETPRDYLLAQLYLAIGVNDLLKAQKIMTVMVYLNLLFNIHNIPEYIYQDQSAILKAFDAAIAEIDLFYAIHNDNYYLVSKASKQLMDTHKINLRSFYMYALECDKTQAVIALLRVMDPDLEKNHSQLMTTQEKHQQFHCLDECAYPTNTDALHDDVMRRSSEPPLKKPRLETSTSKSITTQSLFVRNKAHNDKSLPNNNVDKRVSY